jgi:hypothetical protein
VPQPGTSTSYSWRGLGGDTATVTVAGTEEGATGRQQPSERDGEDGCCCWDLVAASYGAQSFWVTWRGQWDGRSAGRPNAPVAVVRPSRLSDLRPGVPHRGGSPLLFVRLPAHLRRCSPPNSPVVIHRRQHASSKSDSDPPSQTKQHQSYDNQAVSRAAMMRGEHSGETETP